MSEIVVSAKSSRQLAKTWPYKRYKAFERELQSAAADWFTTRGFDTQTKKPYCLRSRDLWHQNIIRSDVVEYIVTQKKSNAGKNSFPIHKYIHHGLSSQAMIFNLVGPLIVRNDLEPLKKAFDSAGQEWRVVTRSAIFEHSDRNVFNEDSGQPTSIDLVISGIKPSLFIEAKLAEKEFGGCSVFEGGDCDGANPCRSSFSSCYLHHIGRKYWQKLEELDFINSTFEKSPICPMANYYQFFRGIMFAIINGGRFLLLYDDRNPTFVRTANGNLAGGLWPFLNTFLPDSHRNDINSISIQNVVNEIELCGRHQDWIKTFREKYGIVSVPTQVGINHS